MPDFIDFHVEILPPATVTVPQTRISGKVVASDDHSNVIADLTGANAILYPSASNQLSDAERIELAQIVVNWIMARRGLV